MANERPRLSLQVAQVFLVAALVGVLVGLLGVGFRLAVESLQSHVASLWHADHSGTAVGWLLATATTASMLGLAVWLVRRFAPEAAGSGVQEIEGALQELRPVRWGRVLPVKFVAGLLSLGCGAVLGREGPTVQMGGATGRLLSDLLRLRQDAGHVLLAAGAAAGLSAAFNAPLAGVLFVIEEMRPHFRYGFLSVQSVLVASACADVVTRVVTGAGPVIAVPELPTPALAALWIFPVYGVFYGALGVVFNRALTGTLDLLDGVPAGARVATAVGIGAFLGAIGWWWSDATGGGYRTINDALHMRLPASGLMLIFALRFLTTVSSYGSGAPGGIFAPMLALGTVFGMAFGHRVELLLPQLAVHPAVFAVAGMAAFFSATVRAPLTGIALAIELTGDFGLILPLLLVCIASTFVAEALGGRPIYELLLERSLRRRPDGSLVSARDG